MKNQPIQNTTFFMLTPDVRDRLLEIKLTAAEWRVWCYLVSLDPFGDRGAKFSPAELMLKCSIKKTTYFATKAKFQKLGLFDFKDGPTKVVNLQTSSEKSKNSTHSQQAEVIESEISEYSQQAKTIEFEISESEFEISESEFEISESEFEISESEFEISESEFEISDNRSPKPLPRKAYKTPQTLQKYSDFIRSLSEETRDNFFEFVKQEIKNLEKPINDLEAWLASKTKAQQNRWEVYFQNYRKHSSRKQISKVEEISAAEKKSAIARWQEHLKQQKLAAEKAREKSNRLEKSPTEQVTEQNSSNHNQATSERPENSLPPTPETPDPWRSEIDQILNNPQGCTKNTSLSSPPPQPDQSQNRKINKHQARDILFTLDLRQRLENSQNQDLGGES
ncbi:MAG: hypothetical protein AAGA80_18225 [Cyanobacteria bacterium P01_F01_bin.143]